MFLIVGLGNPGSDYAGNRHNIGFMAVDRIVRRHSPSGDYTKKFQGLVKTATDVNGYKIVFLKPTTWMNNSGQSVASAAKFYKLPPEKIIVFHDDLDINPGKVKVKKGGGAAGHNGLKSITAHLGDGYKRVRMGIGHPGNKEIVSQYVLQDFAKTDRKWLITLFENIADSFSLLLEDNDAEFMNKVSLDSIG